MRAVQVLDGEIGALEDGGDREDDEEALPGEPRLARRIDLLVVVLADAVLLGLEVHGLVAGERHDGGLET